MIEDDVRQELSRIGSRLSVRGAPVDAILAAARSRRRGRRLIGGAVGVAVILASIGGAMILRIPLTDHRPAIAGTPTVAQPTPNQTPANPPGTRLVGIGRAMIAVPEGWRTNEHWCGTPQRDTVIIDLGGTCLAAIPREKGIESIELSEGDPRFDFVADEKIMVDGTEAQRQRTRCGRPNSFEKYEVCHGTVYLPSIKVSFRAESSTGASEVDRILAEIRLIADDHAVVPGFQTIEAPPSGRDGDLFADKVRAAGLKPVLTTKEEPGLPAGHILEVSPTPGTLLRPGSEVIIIVVPEPDGPGDEVRIGLSYRSGSEQESLEDAELRAGAKITLAVGDEVWAFAQGNNPEVSLAGDLDGTGLAVNPSKDTPNYPRSWVATEPGRTKITLTVTGGGRTETVGTVIVTVR